MWTLQLVFMAALAWAWFGHTDIVAVASGKVVPAGMAKTLQSYSNGVITKILVQNGQFVRKGDPLVLLDRTERLTETRQLDSELLETQNHWLVETSYLEFLQQPAPQRTSKAILAESAKRLKISIPASSTGELGELLKARMKEYLSTITTMDEQLEALRYTRASATATLEKLEKTLPLIRERAEAHKALLDRQLASRDQYLQLEQLHIEQHYARNAERAQLASLDARGAELQARSSQFRDQQKRKAMEGVAEMKHRVYKLHQALKKSAMQLKQQTLLAPIDGIVHELQVHTLGGVLVAGQTVLTIIPNNAHLEVQALVKNHDVGFIREGMDTAVKVDTYSFTRYGTIDGRVKVLSADAVVQDSGSMVYPATVALTKNSLQVNGVERQLVPGMSVTVEIKTGRRRILEFFLSPILKLGRESIRER